MDVSHIKVISLQTPESETIIEICLQYHQNQNLRWSSRCSIGHNPLYSFNLSGRSSACFCVHPLRKISYKSYNEAKILSIFWYSDLKYLIQKKFKTKVKCRVTCSDSSSLMFVRPSMVALTVERIFSWVLMVGIRSHTFGKIKRKSELDVTSKTSQR